MGFREDSWIRISLLERVPEGEARKIPFPRAGGPDELVLCRIGGRLYAIDGRCPHEGGRIAEGPLAGGRHVFCPLHLYKFDPRDGLAVDVECEPARTYPVRESNGAVEVRVDADPAKRI